jgi:pre-rRNA-processing protein TSR3
MEIIRRKILSSRAFQGSTDKGKTQAPQHIPRPTQSKEPDPEPDAEGSDNEGANDDFDVLIDATPATDKVGLKKLEQERARAQMHKA